MTAMTEEKKNKIRKERGEIWQVIADMSANLPPVLYKYCTMEKAGNILRENSLLLASPKKFNDPFDLQFSVLPLADKTLKEKVYQVHKKSGGSKIEALESARRRVAQMEKSGELPPSVQKKINAIGVTCFSSCNKSILMWGHYAKAHQGVCLGFNTQLLLNCADRNGCMPTQIQYSDEYPMWNMDPQVENIRSIMTKAQCWAYEQEWRLLGMEKAGNKLPFPKDTLKSITFGIKANDKDISNIRNLARSMGYSLDFYKAEKVKNNYKINVTPLTRRRKS